MEDIIKVSIILSVFALGFLFTISYRHKDLIKEPFDLTNKCPNLLIRKGKEIHLVNTNKALIPGANPIKFKSLEEYSQFIEYQKHLKIKCPILYYQETYDTQNNKGYRLHSDPLNPQPGLPSKIAKEYDINENPIISQEKKEKVEVEFQVDNTGHLKQKSPQDYTIKHNNFTQSMDINDQEVGKLTHLDNIMMDTNPMASKWKGHDATNKAVEMGDFDGQKREKNAWIDEELKLRQVQCSGK
jgi:hypothetical protein